MNGPEDSNMLRDMVRAPETTTARPGDAEALDRLENELTIHASDEQDQFLADIAIACRLGRQALRRGPALAEAHRKIDVLALALHDLFDRLHESERLANRALANANVLSLDRERVRTLARRFQEQRDADEASPATEPEVADA